MPDGCRRLGKRIVPVATAFDWILSLNGRAALIDTKSHDDFTFRHSKITPHQALELRLHERQGIVAGYVIHLRKANAVVYASAGLLCARIGKNGSIALGDPGVVLLGGYQDFNPAILLRPGFLLPMNTANQV